MLGSCVCTASLIALRVRQSLVPGANGYMPGNSPRMSARLCGQVVAGSSGLCISHVFSFAALGCLVGMLSLASIQQCSGLTRCTSFRVQSPLGVNMQE